MNTKGLFEKLEGLVCANPVQGKKLSLFLENKLNENERNDFIEHVSYCEKCSKIIFLNEHIDKIKTVDGVAATV